MYLYENCAIIHTGLLPDLAEFNKSIRPEVATEWHDLGVELKLDVHKLNNIRTNHQGNVEQSCSAMYQLWLQTDPHASQEKLVTALKNIGFATLAERVTNSDNLYGKTVMNVIVQLQYLQFRCQVNY